jgi:hypothetical protein
MNEVAKNDNRPAVRKTDPREVLDPKKRTKICGLLSLGYSRNMAAEYVGCDPSTISRTAKRDEAFRAQLADAESETSIDALRLIRHTGSQERYWRAAAWVLERRHPDEYGRRAPNTFTGEQVMRILERALEVVMPSVPAWQVPEVMCDFQEEFSDVAEKARMSLPEYEPPEEEENEHHDEAPPIDLRHVDRPRIADQFQPAAASPPAIPQAPVSPVRAPMLPTQPGQGAVPPVDRLPPAMAAVLAESPKHVSCLEQFVERRPKAAATASGRR